MTELARGTIADRPWGKTLGALGMRGLSGQLTLTSEGKQYCIAFANGAVVGASSPLANDAGVRLALTGHLISSTQVAEITRRIAASPDRDEVSVIAEQAKLTSEQAQKLRRRLVAQRAARTFSIERGEFVVHDVVSLPILPGSELDIRAVIYLGARSNLSESRLAIELTQMGGSFKLRPDSVDDLPQYGFSDAEQSVLARLSVWSSVTELQAAHGELTDHGVHAVIYSLMSCNACESGAGPTVVPSRTQTPSAPPAISRTQTPLVSRAQTPTNPQQPRQTPPRGYSVTNAPTELRRMPTAPIEDTPLTRASSDTGSNPSMPRVHTGDRPADRPIGMRPTDSGESSPAVRSTGTTPPAIARTSSPNHISESGIGRKTPPGGNPSLPQAQSGSNPNLPRAQTPTGSTPAIPRVATPPNAELVRNKPPSAPPANRSRKNDPAAKETEVLIAEKVALLDSGADHFKLIGVGTEAPADEVRNAYFALARKLHPDRLASLGISDDKRDAQRLFAQINTAFGVLTNPAQRAEYVSLLGRGGEAAVKAEETKVEDLAMRVMKAEEAFRRGEMAMRRDQLTQAIADFQQAAELQPNEAEYHALLAWAKFAAAPDKVAVASATKGALLKADSQSPNSVTARFYLGRVERMLGREKEALNHFQEVLRVKPHHAEASSEVRVLESRLSKKR
jgi:hypothetical protein